VERCFGETLGPFTPKTITIMIKNIVDDIAEFFQLMSDKNIDNQSESTLL